MSTRVRLLLVGIAVMLAGGGFVGLRLASTHTPPSAASVTASPRTVRVQELQSNADVGAETFTGVVRARHESDLSFRVGGKVIARYVDVGSHVKPGQALARLDPGDGALAVKESQADLAAAEAAFTQASIDYERTTRLIATSAVAAAELDRARAERDGAEARRARARASVLLAGNRLAYCALTADTAGVVTSLALEVGQVVGEGQVVARVARAGELEAVVSIPEGRVAIVRAGTATVTFWSRQGAPLAASLRELSPSADPVTRTYEARFTIHAPGPEIALGMTVTVRVAPAQPSAGYEVPLSAVLRKGTAPALWVVDRPSGRLTLTEVDVVRYRQDAALVTGGVKRGDLVVTAGVQKLDSGMTVRPWEPSR